MPFWVILIITRASGVATLDETTAMTPVARPGPGHPAGPGRVPAHQQLRPPDRGALAAGLAGAEPGLRRGPARRHAGRGALRLRRATGRGSSRSRLRAACARAALRGARRRASSRCSRWPPSRPASPACCSRTGRRRSSARRCWWPSPWPSWAACCSSPTAARPTAGRRGDAVDVSLARRAAHRRRPGAGPRARRLALRAPPSAWPCSSATGGQEAARFSFLLATPITVGGRAAARCPHLLGGADRSRRSCSGWSRRRWSGLLSIRVLLAYVRTRDYRPFAYYRWAFAAARARGVPGPRAALACG